MIDKSVSEVCSSKHWHPDYTVFIYGIIALWGNAEK